MKKRSHFLSCLNPRRNNSYYKNQSYNWVQEMKLVNKFLNITLKGRFFHQTYFNEFNLLFQNNSNSEPGKNFGTIFLFLKFVALRAIYWRLHLKLTILLNFTMFDSLLNHFSKFIFLGLLYILLGYVIMTPKKKCCFQSCKTRSFVKRLLYNQLAWEQFLII